MSGLILIFAIWCCFAIPIGWGMAKIEQKVNNLPEPRTKSAILFSVFLGPIGWIILAMRSGMKFAGSPPPSCRHRPGVHPGGPGVIPHRPGHVHGTVGIRPLHRRVRPLVGQAAIRQRELIISPTRRSGNDGPTADARTPASATGTSLRSPPPQG
jgi:hypothetical protein